MQKLPIVLSMILAAALSVIVSAAQVEIRVKDGSRWRGSVNDNVQIRFNMQGVAATMEGRIIKVEDLYVQVDGTFAGRREKKTIFKSDIETITTLTPASDSPASETTASGDSGTGQIQKASDAPVAASGTELGVFVLPMKGMVGEGFRSDEIKKLAEHCDKFGPGQIMVLEIESGGGLGIEMEKIHYTIAEIRKRHRVVAWIKEAISAAAATASNCDEIYFTTTGTLGAMTGFAGGVSLKGEELQKWLDSAGRWMESGGRSKYIAWAMIDDEVLLSYDKDPDTGEVTWHNDLSGAKVLSDEKTNLVFTATTAMDSGFADGIADTKEELAGLLNLPKWHEKSDYGRKISKEWLDLVERAKQEIPLLFARYSYKGAADGGRAQLGNQIQIIKDLIRWWDRCPNVCFLTGVPPKDVLERQLEEHKRALQQMR